MPKGAGNLYFKLEIILVREIHAIRVAFQDLAMYASISFRGAKASEIWKKGVFLVMVTNFGKDVMEN